MAPLNVADLTVHLQIDAGTLGPGPAFGNLLHLLEQISGVKAPVQPAGPVGYVEYGGVTYPVYPGDAEFAEQVQREVMTPALAAISESIDAAGRPERNTTSTSAQYAPRAPFDRARREDVAQNAPVELLIREAMAAVEQIGAAPILIHALTLLDRARNLVADAIDGGQVNYATLTAGAADTILTARLERRAREAADDARADIVAAIERCAELLQGDRARVTERITYQHAADVARRTDPHLAQVDHSPESAAARERVAAGLDPLFEQPYADSPARQRDHDRHADADLEVGPCHDC